MNIQYRIEDTGFCLSILRIEKNHAIVISCQWINRITTAIFKDVIF